MWLPGAFNSKRLERVRVAANMRDPVEWVSSCTVPIVTSFIQERLDCLPMH